MSLILEPPDVFLTTSAEYQVEQSCGNIVREEQGKMMYLPCCLHRKSLYLHQICQLLLCLMFLLFLWKVVNRLFFPWVCWQHAGSPHLNLGVSCCDSSLCIFPLCLDLSTAPIWSVFSNSRLDSYSFLEHLWQVEYLLIWRKSMRNMSQNSTFH